MGVLLVHLLRADLARVQVGGHDGEDGLSIGVGQVHLQPAPGVHVRLLGLASHAVAGLAQADRPALAHGDAHPSAPLDPAGPDQRGVAGQQGRGRLLVRPHLLQQQDVRS